MSIDLNQELNSEQAKAAGNIHGPSLIIAGAGSGKTRMITYRIAYMLEQGIKESEILALTFTNKAAKEMSERIKSLTGLKLKGLTALMIPVGGFYTIDAVQAKALVDELKPRAVIPMHYRGKGFGYDVIGPLDDFTKLFDQVKEYSGSQLEAASDIPDQVAVLKPMNV